MTPMERAMMPPTVPTSVEPGCIQIVARRSCLRQTNQNPGNPKMIFDRTAQGAQKWYTENRTVLNSGAHLPSWGRRGSRNPRK